MWKVFFLGLRTCPKTEPCRVLNTSNPPTSSNQSPRTLPELDVEIMTQTFKQARHKKRYVPRTGDIKEGRGKGSNEILKDQKLREKGKNLERTRSCKILSWLFLKAGSSDLESTLRELQGEKQIAYRLSFWILSQNTQSYHAG